MGSSTPWAAGATEDSQQQHHYQQQQQQQQQQYTPPCLRKPTSSNLSPTLLSSNLRRLSVSWMLTRTVFSRPPTLLPPLELMERTSAAVKLKLCSTRWMDP